MLARHPRLSYAVNKTLGMLSESAEYDSQDPACLENSKFSELPGHAWIVYRANSETQIHSKIIVKTMVWE